MQIRNIAIIAHVDHGKTTITDAIMRQTGAAKEGVTMDTNALEQERGITIYSKNAAVIYKDTKINIVDTPGHADFGSEVERVLRSIDDVLLVVDAQEGPMPQTRFVLKKSLELGLKPIVIINKIDKAAADPNRTYEQVLELFMELGANNDQLDFPVVYAIGREGIAKKNLNDDSKDLSPLLDMILEKIPPASQNIDLPFRAQPFNLGYDNFLGRLAIVRVYEGKIKTGDLAYVKKASGNSPGSTPSAGGEIFSGKIAKLFTFHGLLREETNEALAGDIVMLAGLPDIFIGDTVAKDQNARLLPSISIDEPTIMLNFLVNNSPFAGRDGKFVTSRQLRERLEKELEINVGLKIDFNEGVGNDKFKVSGRGELHIAILLENLRREGYELQVSQPHVIIKEVSGKKCEPFEEITVDIPSEYQGTVIEKLGKRGSIMQDLKQHGPLTRIIFEGPTRGLLGYRNQFIIDTKGEGIFASRVIGFKPYAGEIEHRTTGSMVSQETGKALSYSLANLQLRGTLYIKENTEVYEGMVIGNTSKGLDLTVNPIKGKHLTNMRSVSSDEAIHLEPPRLLNIERGLEIMSDDEYLEVTPKNVRLRKQYLAEVDRIRSARQG